MGEVEERGKERCVEGNRAGGGQGGWLLERTSGGAGGAERSDVPALIEVAGTARSVVGNGLGLGGIELGALIEVVGEGVLGDVVSHPTAGPHSELSLVRCPGRMEEGGRCALPDVGEDLRDGLGVVG